MNITENVRTEWNTHLVETFGRDAQFVNQNLPLFEAYVVNGTVRLFAGRLTENSADVLNRAVERYVDRTTFEMVQAA